MISASYSERVAVLDDDIRFIRMVERILCDEGIGVQPITTLNLDEAVGVVAASDCVLALVDLYMYGDCAGFALIEKLRQNPATARLPIIVTSGAHRAIGRKVTFLLQHECNVLLKPFNVEDLVTKVRSAIADRAPVTHDALPATSVSRYSEVVRAEGRERDDRGCAAQHSVSRLAQLRELPEVHAKYP